MSAGEVFIISHARTPIGSFKGTLSPVSATKLGSVAIKGAIERAGINSNEVQEVIMGNVLQAGLGQAPARQACLGAGLPNSVPCTTVNKVCASGMKAIIYAAQSLMLGNADVVVAGGMESMTNAPFYLPRTEIPYGGIDIKDTLVNDGLTDAHGQGHMGMCAEGIAQKFNFTRINQDDYAVKSYKKTLEAAESGFLKEEIVPVYIPGKSGKPDTVFDMDEDYKKVNFDKIPTLRSVFMDKGTITAANASSLSDGAAACVMASKSAVQSLNLVPLAKVIAFADAAVDPQDFPIAPAYAIPKILSKANLQKSEIDLWEINEAFSVAALSNMKILNLDSDKVNIRGGAVSIGHPLGMSGARIVTRLVHCLKSNQKGIAAICNGGGGASAILVERI